MARRFRLLAALVMVALAACKDESPPIGRDLPNMFADARPIFDKQVKTQFPIGSSESDLLGELIREKFTVTSLDQKSSPYTKQATAEIKRFPCNIWWLISWSAEANKITAIEGMYGSTCP
jgi:hypothetical protein